MKEFKIGDEVIDGNEKPSKVAGVMCDHLWLAYPDGSFVTWHMSDVKHAPTKPSYPTEGIVRVFFDYKGQIGVGYFEKDVVLLKNDSVLLIDIAEHLKLRSLANDLEIKNTDLKNKLARHEARERAEAKGWYVAFAAHPINKWVVYGPTIEHELSPRYFTLDNAIDAMIRLAGTRGGE